MAHTRNRASSGRTIVAATALALAGPGVAHAGFVGSTVHVAYLAEVEDSPEPDLYAEGHATVSATEIEFATFNASPTWMIDVKDASIRVDNFFDAFVPVDTFTADFPFLGLVMTFDGPTAPTIAGASVESNANALAVTHTHDTIRFNWAGLTYSPQTWMDVAVTFVPTPGEEEPSTSMPEPAATGLIAGALGLAAMATKRRRSTSRAA